MSRDRSCLGPKIPSMYGKGMCTILCAKPTSSRLRTNYAGWTWTNYAGSRSCAEASRERRTALLIRAR